MRKLVTVGLAAVLCMAASVGTSRAETAIGAVFGYPGNVGLSMRFDHTQFNVAWSDDFLHGTADMWLKLTPMKDGEGKLSWYYGAGVDAGIPMNDDHDFFLAGRVPFGLQFMASPKLELFGELAPGVQVLSDFDFYWAGSAGIRLVLGK
jgi:hypothetical protein